MKRILLILSLLTGCLPSLVFANTVTLYPASGANYPVDGYTRYTGSFVPPTSWNSGLNANGSFGYDSQSDIKVGITQGLPHTFNRWFRGYIDFDFPSSTIPASSTINSATFGLYDTGNTALTCTLITAAQEGLRVSDNTAASTSAIAASDYQTFIGNTHHYTTDFVANNWVSNSYNTTTFNGAGVTYLQNFVGGGSQTIKLGLRVAAEADNSQPASETCDTTYDFYAADNGSSTIPYLSIDYSLFSPPVSPASSSTIAMAVDMARANSGIIMVIGMAAILLWISLIKIS